MSEKEKQINPNIDQSLPYRPEWNYNEENRKKFPNCSICGEKLIYGEEVIGVMRDGKYFAQLCSNECMEEWEKKTLDEIL